MMVCSSMLQSLQTSNLWLWGLTFCLIVLGIFQMFVSFIDFGIGRRTNLQIWTFRYISIFESESNSIARASPYHVNKSRSQRIPSESVENGTEAGSKSGRIHLLALCIGERISSLLSAQRFFSQNRALFRIRQWAHHSKQHEWQRLHHQGRSPRFSAPLHHRMHSTFYKWRYLPRVLLHLHQRASSLQSYLRSPISPIVPYISTNFARFLDQVRFFLFFHPPRRFFRTLFLPSKVQITAIPHR